MPVVFTLALHHHQAQSSEACSIPSQRLGSFFLCVGKKDNYRSTMSSLKHPSPGFEESGAEELYFSFGSNMPLQQMAARCHDSRLFAKGILGKLQMADQ